MKGDLVYNRDVTADWDQLFNKCCQEKFIIGTKENKTVSLSCTNINFSQNKF